MFTEYVFVYGTLKRGEPNHHWITSQDSGSAEFVGTGQTVELYPLVIATKYNIPFLLHHKGHGNNVDGEVYKVDEAMLHHLDVLEDHPHLYVREVYDIRLVSVEGNASASAGDVVKCWVYFLKDFKGELLQLQQFHTYSSEGEHGLRYAERYLRDPHYEHTWEVKLRNS